MSTPPSEVSPIPPSNSLSLPFITPEIAPIQAQIRAVPTDFVVDEVPAYAPSGSGDHLWIHFEKTGLGTPEAVKQLARVLGVAPRDAGYAGLKDKHAITRQWASFLFGDAKKLENIELAGVRILMVTRHGNKLRTGHLRGNRFELVLRNVARGRESDVARVLEALSAHGVPNYFGEQRFGREGRNVDDARAWLIEGGPPPRDMWKRKLLVSVLQSVVFNDVVATRIRDGLFADAVDGDLLRKEDTGGLFVTDDLEDARKRVAAWEISPTGPMFGTGMRAAERESKRREDAAMAASGLLPEHLERFGRAGEGTRRVMRIRPAELTHSFSDAETLHLSFTLPKGAYATVLVRELVKAHTAELPADLEDA